MFNFVKSSKWCALISVVIILAGAVSLIINRGFEVDIDFAGGCKMVVDTNGATNTDRETIKNAVESVEGIKFYESVKMGDNMLQIKTNSNEKFEEIYAAVKDAAGLKAEKYKSCDNVDPTLSRDLLTNALIALAVAIVGILIYICIRFEFGAAIAAIIALVHDALIMVSAYAIFRFTVNSTFVAAVLTIIGYSVNATIIIFDRVRENKKYAGKNSFEELCNKSIFQTLRRTINTTITTLVALVCLYVLGAESIKAFALPIMIGVLAGTYSSVFISAPVWNLVRGIIKKK